MVREINIGFYFFPVFALNAFSILIFPPSSSNLGISPWLILYMGCISLVWVFFNFTSIGFISHVGSRQIS